MFCTDGIDVADVEAADTAEKIEEPDVSREPAMDIDSIARGFGSNRSEDDVGELRTLLEEVSISKPERSSIGVAVETPVSSRR